MDFHFNVKGKRIRVKDEFGRMIDEIREEDEAKAGYRLAKVLRKIR